MKFNFAFISIIGHTKVESNNLTIVEQSIFANIQQLSDYQGTIDQENAAYTNFNLHQFHTYNELTEIRFHCTKQWHGRKVNMVVKNEQFLRQ